MRLPLARLVLVFAALALVAVACTSGAATPDSGPASATSEDATNEEAADEDATNEERADPEEVYNPVFEGESVPRGFNQLLRRDDILPIYEPTFVSASQVDWPLDGLVVGVDLEGEARAYPVGALNSREMVIDNHRGIPTLVTW